MKFFVFRLPRLHTKIPIVENYFPFLSFISFLFLSFLSVPLLSFPFLSFISFPLLYFPSLSFPSFPSLPFLPFLPFPSPVDSLHQASQSEDGANSLSCRCGQHAGCLFWLKGKERKGIGASLLECGASLLEA